MSLFDLKKEVNKKQNELKLINERIENTNKLTQLDQNIQKVKESEKKTLELDKISNSYKTKLSEGVFALKLNSINIDFDTHTNNLFALGLEYERFIFRDIIGLNISMSYLIGTKTQAQLDARSTPNTTSKKDYHSHKGYDLALSIPFHINYLTIAAKLGYSNISYEETANIYNNFGVALNVESETNKFNNSFSGLNLKLGNSFFGEIETRKYFNQDNIRTSVGVGIKVNY